MREAARTVSSGHMKNADCWKCHGPLDDSARSAGRCPACGAPIALAAKVPSGAPGAPIAPPTPAPPRADPFLETLALEPVRVAPKALAHAETVRWEGPAQTRLDPGRDQDPQKTGVVGVQGEGTTQREALGPPSGLRRYRGGGTITADGVEVSGHASEAVELPYTKAEVRMRIGAYDVLRELGRGGMGVVFLGYSLKLCRHVAIKMMTSGRFASEAEIVRFQNEAMLAARLEHPHIVPVYDAGEHEGNLYFVMGFVEGTGFGALIDAQKQALADKKPTEVHLERGLLVLSKAARALDFAHRRGIVHRDIKPDNILVDKDGEPHLTDFGIAKNIQREVSITKPGAIVGTPTYMAPEQANNIADRVGPAADVYSLGATLYHLATGREPFEGPTPLAILISVLHNLPDNPKGVAKKTLGRDLPPDLETIILKAMEKRASDRYESARAFAEDLERFLEDKPVSARPVGAAERLKKLVRRNRAAFVLGLAAIVTLVFMAVGFGTVLVFNLDRTSDTLWAQDEQGALAQALTLERTITTNMLEGRADIVRSLVDRLRADPKVGKIDVVRTDKTLAYTDTSTRELVAKRLVDPQIRKAIAAMDPAFERKLAMLESVAFASIDEAAGPNKDPIDSPRFAVDEALWRELLTTRETKTRVTEVEGVPHLVVYKPILNGKKCQNCHGEASDGTAAGEPGGAVNPYASTYADPGNHIRAILVVSRSQAEVKAKIAANTRDTLMVGGLTTLGFLAVLFLAVKLFGVRLRPQRYG